MSTATPTPPDSYKSRVVAQLVLSGILCFTLSLFIVLSIHNRIRTGRKFRLVYLQQLSEGSIIVLDALIVSVIFGWLGTICLTVSLVYRYKKYVLGHTVPWQVDILVVFVSACASLMLRIMLTTLLLQCAHNSSTTLSGLALTNFIMTAQLDSFRVGATSSPTWQQQCR